MNTLVFIERLMHAVLMLKLCTREAKRRNLRLSKAVKKSVLISTSTLYVLYPFSEGEEERLLADLNKAAIQEGIDLTKIKNDMLLDLMFQYSVEYHKVLIEREMKN